MFIKLKNVLLMLICAAVVIELGGCMYDRHERRSDRDIQREHEHIQGPSELDIRVR